MQDDDTIGSTLPRRPSGPQTHAGTFVVWPGWLLLMHDAGVNGADVLRRAGLPADLFGRAGTRLDSQTYFRLWAAIEADTAPGQGPIPLRLARKMSADWFEPELFVALCSDDMNGALARLATLGPMRPLRVGWPEPPRSAQEARAYAAYFGIGVDRTPMPTLVFAVEDAKRPFLTANHGMWSVFEPALRQRLADLDAHASTVDRVRGALLEALPGGELSMRAVCRKLGVSGRTLQRRLKEEGSSFQQTLDATRSALAHHYLRHSSMSGAEISFLIGFEDPNSFVRAFQVWTGTTPQAVRSAARDVPLGSPPPGPPRPAVERRVDRLARSASAPRQEARHSATQSGRGDRPGMPDTIDSGTRT